MQEFRARSQHPGSKRGLLRSFAAVTGCVAIAAGAAACGSSGGGGGGSSSNTNAAGGSGGSTKSAKPVSVNLEVYQGSYYTWLPYIASAEGFFTKNGINAKLIPVTGGGAVAFAALANGGADVAMGDLSLAGPMIAKGVGLTAITGAVNAGWELIAPKGSTVPTTYPASVNALKGKAVGVVALGTSSYYYLQQLAAQSGVGKHGLTYVALGGVPANAVSALQANRAAAAMVSPDVAYYLTKDLGMKLVYDFNDASALHQAGGLLSSSAGKASGWMWARNGWISAHPGATQKFQLAMEEADVWAHNPANLSKVIALLSKQGDLAKFEEGAGASKFFAYALPDVISYVPSGSADVIRTFWTSNGLLPKDFPASSKWYSSTIPASAAQVVANVKAAGQGSLGSKA